ncbi:MAG: GNAT family N-acetyltransferase [Promethearchaeati archaeon SRVP18_Atabeyarchaeia-1]
MTLTFRSFKHEDATGVVRLYNECFQSYRTVEEWKWMYLQMPDFDPSGILVGEDEDLHEIVGSLVVCKHPALINDRKRLVGIVDDVDTSHKWRGKGIATRLMRMAIEESKKAGCSALFLYANPSGEAAGIYRRLGFRDAKYFYYNGKTASVGYLARKLPFPVNLASPLATLFSGLNSIRCRGLKREARIERLECANDRQFDSYLEALNGSLQGMPLFYPYSKERLAWMICRAPKTISPLARFIEESGKILCGANASIYKMRFFGRVFNSWVISDIFASPSLKSPEREGYLQCLIKRLAQDGEERGCALQMAPLSQHDKDMNKSLKPSGFFRLIPTTFMCLPLEHGFSLPPQGIPWYFWKQHMIGSP